MIKLQRDEVWVCVTFGKLPLHTGKQVKNKIEYTNEQSYGQRMCRFCVFEKKWIWGSYDERKRGYATAFRR